MFADLYAAGGERGIDRAVIDASELWEVAAMLGLDYDRTPPPSDAKAPGLRSPRRNLTAERMRAARGEGPPPEAEPTGAALVSMAMRSSGARRGRD